MNLLALRIFRGIALGLLLAIAAVAPSSAGDSAEAEVSSLVSLLELVIDADPDSARQCLQTLAAKLKSGEVDAKTSAELKERLAEPLAKLIADDKSPLFADAALLAALWQQPAALGIARGLATRDGVSPDVRQLALETLVVANDDSLLETTEALLQARGDAAAGKQRAVLTALARSKEPGIAGLVLGAYPTLAAESQPLAIELLTQRAAWSKALVAEVAAGRIPPAALNVNQVRKLLALGDAAIAKEVTRHWGTVREGRDPAREQLIRQMRGVLARTPGDPYRGKLVFNKLCGQCHKLHGEGQEVGPDITANGRASYDQLLSNVFDPSLVIGASYQARTIRTIDGRIVTGLLAEDSEQRVVLKVQGGKLETIAREDVEATKVSELSLMPEGIEKQLQPQEIADLFALLTLDKPPEDPSALPIPGAGAIRRP